MNVLWWLLLPVVLFPIIRFVAALIHELGHASFALAYGYQIVKFRVGPPNYSFNLLGTEIQFGISKRPGGTVTHAGYGKTIAENIITFGGILFSFLTFILSGIIGAPLLYSLISDNWVKRLLQIDSKMGLQLLFLTLAYASFEYFIDTSIPRYTYKIYSEERVGNRIVVENQNDMAKILFRIRESRKLNFDQMEKAIKMDIVINSSTNAVHKICDAVTKKGYLFIIICLIIVKIAFNPL